MREVPKPKSYHSYSQCYNDRGEAYHLVVMWDRVPFLKGEPLRVHGTSSISKARAYAAALDAWNSAYRALTAS